MSHQPWRQGPRARVGQARGGDGARRLRRPLQRRVRLLAARSQGFGDRLPGARGAKRLRTLGVDSARFGPRPAARPTTVPSPRPTAGLMHIVAFLLTLQAPLIPQPREFVAQPDIALRGGVAIAPGTTAEDRFTVQDLADGLRARGVRVVAAGTVGAVPVVLARTATVTARQLLAARHLTFDSTMHDEGYVLVASGGRVTIVATTGTGVFYGAQTLLQLVAGE